VTQSAQDFAATNGVRRTRIGRQEEAHLSAYRDESAPGANKPLPGDDVGPYSRPRPLPLLRSSTSDPDGELFRIVDEPVRLYELVAFNVTGGDLYVLVFDDTTVPANGSVPILPAMRVPTITTIAASIPEGGIDLFKGAVVVFSTTALTLTATVPAGSITIMYREPDQES
jgi:hypothetical protein